MLPALEVFEIVSLVALAACAVWLTRRSMPARLEFRQKRIEGIVAEFDARVTEIVEAGAAQRVQFQSMAQEVETYLGQIERKRASTAASASRLSASAEPVKVENLSRADQLAWARRQSA